VTLSVFRGREPEEQVARLEAHYLPRLVTSYA
jgi:hypothetical protein